MKLSKKAVHFQRAQIDEQLNGIGRLKATTRPRRGWVKAIREALGITTRQLAERLGSNNSSITRLEHRELEGRVTIDVLERAAQAMGCHFIYAIVPDESLEQTLSTKAHEAALRVLEPVKQSMRLEKQGVSEAVTEKQVEALAKQLKERLDPLLWKK